MKVLIIDVETIGTKGRQVLPYDIGYLIFDTIKNIVLVKRSFAIYELFIEKQDLLQTAYYKEKIPLYWKEIKAGKRILWGFNVIKTCIYKDIQNYNVKRVFAYNASFDINSLNCANIVFLNDYSPFFKDLEVGCLWAMSCQILCTENYIRFCIENGYFSEKGYIKTGAEFLYRYITKNTEFQEEHRGLEDVLIETEIFKKILKRKKRMNIQINTRCYRDVQEKYINFLRKRDNRNARKRE